MSDDFFAGLENDVDFDSNNPHRQIARNAERPTFPCQSCLGTGKYRGIRVNRQESRCFSCDGRGHFFTSPSERFKNKARRIERKVQSIADTLNAFKKENPGLYEFLGNATWSPFLTDMFNQINAGKELSERQLAAAKNSKAKSDERDAARAEERAKRIENAPVVDLSTIHDMFNKARENGLSKLAYRAEGLVLTPAKSHSANAGGIYVKTTGGDYIGKVMGTKFLAVSAATPEHKTVLETIARNPSEVAREYGKRVGICSCCGRELTDPESIKAGIGPICADKWGF